KLVWIVARGFCHEWRRHLVVVRPETVVAWHRRGWRLFWWCRSRCPVGRPRLSEDVRALIATMARDNPRWGTERIRGELLKLGVTSLLTPIRAPRAKAYALHCTPLARSGKMVCRARRGLPCDLRGASSPGGSYRQEPLSL